MAEAEGGRDGAGSGMGKPAPAGAAFKDALASAARNSADAARLFGVLAFLAPRKIPLDIITSDVMPPSDRSKAVAALIGAGLARASSEAGGAADETALDVAGEIQAEMRAHLVGAGSDGEAVLLATRLLAEAYPHGDQDPGEASTWLVCQRLEDHVRAVLQHAPDDGEGAAATSQLLHQYSQYLFARGKLEDAEAVMRRAGAIAEAMLGPAHPRVGQDSADLAVLLYESGRVEEALPYIRRAMSVDEAAFGPEHPVVAERYNMMATLLETLGRPAEADPYIRHAVLAAEKTLGPDHPDTVLYRENYEKVITAMDAVARRDDAVEAGTVPAPPERLARPDIPPPPTLRDNPGLLGRLRRRS